MTEFLTENRTGMTEENKQYSGDILLEVKDLTVSFQSGGKLLPAVTDLSFHLKKGEILALVGESGCGKSISCMALSRLLPENARILSGSVRLRQGKNGTSGGEEEIFPDILKLKEKELRKVRGGQIAYIFQEPAVSLNPVFTVGSQIREVLCLHREDVTDPEAEAIRILEMVGISDPANRVNLYPHEMSGGMLQRVMIGMAIASRPALLVADEPTTALDVTIQAQILELLRRLRKELNMSMILVTHNLGIVAETADRVAVMYAGRIVESGRVPDVLGDPLHPYTKALLGAVPVLGGDSTRLATIPGHVALPGEFPAGCRFCTRCTLCRTIPEQERCREEVPSMKKISGPDHFFACHFSQRTGDGISNGEEEEEEGSFRR